MSTLRSVEYKICRTTNVQEKLRDLGLKGSIVFTNGCFDLIHTGHITYLSKAADLGDHLIIGLNSDTSVKRLKGESRPVKTEMNRALVLASFEYVDMVVIFEEDTPVELIKTIQPDVLVKGGDYDPLCTDPDDPKYIVGSDFIRQNGGKVETIGFVDGYSTTGLIGNMD